MASFMVQRESTPWRWSHMRHHSDTIIVGRDREIAVPRPPQLRVLLLNFIGWKNMRFYFRNVLRHCLGRLDAGGAQLHPGTGTCQGVFQGTDLFPDLRLCDLMGGVLGQPSAANVRGSAQRVWRTG